MRDGHNNPAGRESYWRMVEHMFPLQRGLPRQQPKGHGVSQSFPPHVSSTIWSSFLVAPSPSCWLESEGVAVAVRAAAAAADDSTVASSSTAAMNTITTAIFLLVAILFLRTL